MSYVCTSWLRHESPTSHVKITTTTNSCSVTLRLSFVRLALLWYHTIVRPFYALDGRNVQAGVETSKQLIDESKTTYHDSALFLFFSGRIHRLSVNCKERPQKTTNTTLFCFVVGNLSSPQRFSVICRKHDPQRSENPFDARGRMVLFDFVGLCGSGSHISIFEKCEQMVETVLRLSWHHQSRILC